MLKRIMIELSSYSFIQDRHTSNHSILEVRVVARLVLYMLQGICETRKYAYFLKLSVNTRIS